MDTHALVGDVACDVESDAWSGSQIGAAKMWAMDVGDGGPLPGLDVMRMSYAE
jgi:hypothetical protein